MQLDIYIIDQQYQIDNEILTLPENATPGFVVEVYRNKKLVDKMWNKTKAKAEEIAGHFYKEYKLAEVWGEFFCQEYGIDI